MKDEIFLENQTAIEMNIIKLQKNLDEKNRAYAGLVGSIPGGICQLSCDDQLTILYANEFYYRIFGYTIETAKASGFNSLRFVTPAAEFAQIQEKLHFCFQQKSQKFEMETQHRNKNGENVWVLARCNYSDGFSGSFICVVLDITARKQMEEDLRISEEEYRVAIQQHTEKIIVRFDIKKRTLARPKWAADLLEIPQVVENVPYEMVDQGYIAKESTDDYISFYEAMLAGKAMGKCVFKLHNQRWYRADYTLVYSEYHEPIRSIVSYEDITEQRERVFAYEKWRQYNETMLENSIAYYECNLTRNLFDRLVGELTTQLPQNIRQSFSAVIAYAAEHFVYEQDRGKYRRFFSREVLLSRYYMGKREMQLEYRRKNAIGKAIWVLTTVQLLPDPYSDDIKGFVLIQNIDKQKQEEVELQNRSQSDPLTGLLNRRAIQEKVDLLLSQRSETEEYAFIMIDIDHFKELNDTLGHLFGDQVLVDIAKALRTLVRTEDLIARIGGDEFMIFLAVPTNEEILVKKAELLCKALFKNFEQDIVISGSLGIAIAPQAGTNFMDLYKNADTALYRAKKYGRNQYVFFQYDMNDDDIAVQGESYRQQLLQDSLQDNASQNHLEMYYNIVLHTLFDELCQMNITKNYYQIIYHSPHKYIMPESEGPLWATLAGMAMEMFHPNDQQRFLNLVSEQRIKQILDEECGAFKEEFRRRRIDGEYQWVVIYLIPFANENGDDIILCFVQDIEDRKQLEYKARRKQETCDALTGYPNFEWLRDECKRILANRGEQKYSLWFCDLKNFKFVNDIYGHDVGDRVLQYWAQKIDESLGVDEAFARNFADNFTVLKRYDDIQELKDQFKRGVELLQNYKEISGNKFKLEMVAGIYLIDSDADVLVLDDMLDRANIAQRQAKSDGGSNMALYSEAMRQKIIYEKAIEAEMHHALRMNEFCVYLQPQVDIQHENAILGAEALVRWRRDDGELVSPDNFIPLFEKNGFVVQLDRYVFKETCRYLRQRFDAGKPMFKIAVNVSRISAFQNDFAEVYIALKKMYDIPDEFLEIEFTETVVVENVQRLDGIMKGMRRQGFLFSLDDFGSGYSSLNMLKDIVVDVLKLDMMFFCAGLNSNREEIIIASVITMAKALDMKIIAEGVETEQQLHQLKKLGCDIVQGYFFGRPVPKDEFEIIYKDMLARIIS